MEKVSGAKTKRFLSNGNLKVEQVFDKDVWNKQLREDLAPVIVGAMMEASATALRESDEKVDMQEEEIQEYIESQLVRAEHVNQTTKKELAGAIILATLLLGDDGDEASLAAKVAMLGTAVGAVFSVLLTKRLKDIAEVESTGAYNAGLFFGGTRAGATTKTWVTRKDQKVRTAHASLQGSTVGIGEGFKAGKHMLRFPGDPLAPPELVINCRCLLKFGEE